MSQRGWAPRPRLSSPGERERHMVMSAGAGEDNMLQSLFSLQLPLTHNLSNKVRGIFFKEVFARLYYCVNMYSACICVYMHIYYVAIQHSFLVLILIRKNNADDIVFKTEFYTKKQERKRQER